MDGNHTCVLALEGEFAGRDSDDLAEMLDRQIERGGSRIVANMRRVRLIDSKSVGCLLRTRRLVTADGGDLVLSEPSGFVERTIQVLGLGKIIRTFASNEEALSHLGIGAA